MYVCMYMYACLSLWIKCKCKCKGIKNFLNVCISVSGVGGWVGVHTLLFFKFVFNSLSFVHVVIRLSSSLSLSEPGDRIGR